MYALQSGSISSKFRPGSGLSIQEARRALLYLPDRKKILAQAIASVSPRSETVRSLCEGRLFLCEMARRLTPPGAGPHVARPPSCARDVLGSSGPG